MSTRSPVKGENAAASGDPYYVFKDELTGKVSSVHQKYTKWKSIYDGKESSKELPMLTNQITSAVTAAENSLKFLEQTIVMVEANRSKFEHIDTAEIASRKEFVSSTRMDLLAISSEISSDAVQIRIRKEEQKQLLKPLTSSSFRKSDDNARFLAEETSRQQQIMSEQDQSVDGLHTSVTHLNHIAVEIHHEIKSQNKMISDLSTEVDVTAEQMNFVMDRMSKMLKTKDKCQLGLILTLCIILTIMVFLVIYT